METSELLKKVRKIEIKTRGLSANMFAGEYHSAFKGRGMSFSEVRGYQYGDDVRNIDWNVTARTGAPFVKIFEEERELTVMLLVDVSRSSFFGTLSQMKNELMTEICAVLAFSAIGNNDKVGVILFSDVIEKFIPPKKGRTHTLRIIRELVNYEPTSSGTNIGLALEYLNNVIKKRSTTFLLSDYMTKGYDNALKIVNRKHDLIGLHVVDPAEEKLPKVGLMRAQDAETGERYWLDTESKITRKRYREWYTDNSAYVKNAFLRTGADLLYIRTNEDYLPRLRDFFRRRASR